MKKMPIILAILATVGLLAGGGAGYMMKKPPQEEAKAEESAPKQELQTDAFSLLLFKQALKENKGNVLVAPHLLSQALSALQEIAAGKTKQELQALGLSHVSTPRNAEPVKATLLAMDYNLPRGEAASSVMPLPFSDKVPMALSLFNGMLAPATGMPDAQLADSKMVTNRTKLLAGCAAFCKKDWAIPFHPANSRMADFDSAGGGMPHFRQMRSRGAYSTAKAEDGSWRAVALPFKSEGITGPSLVYIAILPAGDARQFATSLSADQLNNIRKALAEAPAEDTLVEIPRIELTVLPYDLRDSLRRMGLKALFDTETADFSPLTPEKVHLAALVQSFSVSLVESASAASADDSLDYAKNLISLNRPYIWLIADLATSTPVEFFGLVEDM